MRHFEVGEIHDQSNVIYKIKIRIKIKEDSHLSVFCSLRVHSLFLISYSHCFHHPNRSAVSTFQLLHPFWILKYCAQKAHEKNLLHSIWRTSKHSIISKKEKKVLFKLVRYPFILQTRFLNYYGLKKRLNIKLNFKSQIKVGIWNCFAQE